MNRDVTGVKGLDVQFPELAAEWHPALNGDLQPSQVTPGSKLQAHWLCGECGNTWQARVGSRTRGHGCPACARRINGKAHSAPASGDSLAERAPDIAAEWHPTRNGELVPDDVGYASNKKVWWQCRNCYYEWQIQVANRSSGSSCRKCAQAALRKPKPGSSLAERNPAVSAEWHPTLNGVMSPADVAFSAKRKAWWSCSQCGHEWEASIGNRATGAGCPPCSRTRGRRTGIIPKRAAPSTDSADTAKPVLTESFPQVAAEWHPIRNGDRTPGDFLPGSNARAWWLCRTCGYEWESIIQSRTRGGAGCRPCGRRRAGAALARPKPGQSLTEQFPDLAAQWHPTRNDALTPDAVAGKSGKQAWWLCPVCANEWSASIGSRADGSGCKSCATQAAAAAYAAPKPGKSLAEQDTEISAQWHPTRNGDLTPTDVTANSGQKVWWQCDRGHEWKAVVNNRSKGSGCPQCILWGTSVEEIRLRHELLAAGVPIDVTHDIHHSATGRKLLCDMVAPQWRIVVEFDGHRFHQPADNHTKDRRKTAALESAGWTVIRVREALDPIGPNDVVVPKFSSEVVRAKAVLVKLHELGHWAGRYDDYLITEEPWASAAADYEVRRPRANSLAVQSPALAAEWDEGKNGSLTPNHVTVSSGQKAWWRCPVCNHSWRAQIASRSGGHGCPECGKASSLKNRNRPGDSLAEKYPDVAAEWHPTRNGEKTPEDISGGSHQKVWWRCTHCGDEWEAVVRSRTGRGAACPNRCSSV
jgi:transposase-like protein